jgi:hemerythrin-like domain-containing protein
MDLIAQLTQEHQDYVLKLSTLAEVVEGIRINGRGDYFIQALDELLKPLTGDLDDHARREEDFLFPRLLERAPQSPVAVMLAEHAEIRERSATFGRWYPIWREGDDSAYDRWSAAALDLRGKFSTHMQKENLILFPLARRVFTVEEVQQFMRLDDR